MSRFAARLRPGAVGCLRGTFHHTLRIHNGGYRLRSAPGSRATIDGLVSFTRTSHDVVLAGLVLRSPNTPNVRINGTRITIRRSVITNGHTGICVSIGGGFERYGLAHGVALLRNRIHDCGRLPPTNHDHGVYVEGSVGSGTTSLRSLATSLSPGATAVARIRPARVVWWRGWSSGSADIT